MVADQVENVDKKVALVTGANRGIGLEVVRQLSEVFDGDIILTSLVLEHGLEAVKKIDSPLGQVIAHQLDITDEESVNNLVRFIKNNYGGLDILINNAAVFITNDYLNATDNWERIVTEVININYFKTADLVDALFPLLRTGARVVNVASTWGLLYIVDSEEKQEQLMSQSLTRKELDALVNEYIDDALNCQHKEKGWINVPTPKLIPEILDHTYRISKLFLIALTNIQKREWLNDPRDIIVNAVHPGFVSTELTSFKGREAVEEGAKSLVHAATKVTNDVPIGELICYPDLTLIRWNVKGVDLNRILDERDCYIKAYE